MPARISVNGFGHTDISFVFADDPFLLNAYKGIVEELNRLKQDEADRRHRFDRKEQFLFALNRKSDGSYTFRPPDSAVTDIHNDDELPKERYHDRVFPKDYAKKRKSKRRTQNRSRRKRS